MIRGIVPTALSPAVLPFLYAVFLLPAQLGVPGVPSPAVTPPKLLFNVMAGPGAPSSMTTLVCSGTSRGSQEAVGQAARKS
ncbi:hypothetical protein [Streptomyces sp. MH60]|uniref:hypothetical protein n=1 Tax=Streptomyces sp. MH60 TaxID=1940758 RepID=UPI000CEE339C|nr:hypothetical protein [Streptomyces sp. MH60]PPS90699.1 hypothetical protein BZZ08_00816 [Streptomyces sp. MH60]